MKNDKPIWSICRVHKVTGAVFFLSPGQVNWVTPAAHEKYGTRYGHWTREEAEGILKVYASYSAWRGWQIQDTFEYTIVNHLSIK